MASIELPVRRRPQADERSFDSMGTRVYVGNLPFDMDASQLRALFEEGGREVADVKIITDRDTGRPRGFAFVEMASQSDAQAAITALNGREVGGRALTVNEAKEQAPRRGGGGGGGFRSGGGGGGGGGRGGGYRGH
jgi:RNA recognition motif-containing protein